MKHEATEVRHYNFTSQDRLFLDANIWLYLDGPQKSKSHWRTTYSKVFSRILNACSQIYIDVLIVSEFINRYTRVRWGVVAPGLNSFKDFRNSPDFKPIAKDITADVKRILKHCSPIESGFAAMEIDDLLDAYALGNSDFNDQVITELCKTNGLTLITNDSDFRSREIPVLTANKSLLS
jgi:predicted nucleic acid-binding protein